MIDSLAEHEAGHSLMAFLVGRRIHSVSITGRDGMTTSIRHRAETIFERVAVHAAGATAEIVVFGGSLSFAGAADDARHIDAAITAHLRVTPHADGRRIYAHSMAEASRVLGMNRFALRGIAAHLRQFGRAGHADIQRIVNHNRG